MPGKLYRSLLLLMLCLLAGYHNYGQNAIPQTFNIYNGLPTNHIYNGIIDRNGYLWIATTKGVVKYNGYSFRIFNSSDGLPKEDVWRLVEDKRGRIWLCCITDELGYIYNDKYYGITIGQNRSSVYPHSLYRFGNGITFSTSYINGQRGAELYRIDSTSASTLSIPIPPVIKDLHFTKTDSLNFIKDNTSLWATRTNIVEDSIVTSLIKNYVFRFVARGEKLVYKDYTKILYPDIERIINEYRPLSVNNFLIFHSPYPSNTFISVNLKNGKYDEVSLIKYGISEDIQFIHNNGDADSNIYVLTANHILLFSTFSNFSKVLIDNYKHFTTDSTLDGNEIRSIYNNGMWGTIFATTNKGLAIRQSLKNYFKPEPTIKLQGFNYVQGVPDEKCYWWNVSTSTLAELDKNYTIRFSKLKNTSVINAIYPYHGDSLLIVGHDNFYMSKNSKKASLVPLSCMSLGVFSWAKTPDNTFIFSCNGGFHFATPVTHDTSNVSILDNIRLPGMVADAKGEEYWAYNNLHIDIYNNKTHQLTKYTREKLIAAGIQKVEKICIDSFNNVYILDNSQLLLFNNRHAKVIKQVSNINIKNCDINIYKNKLIITGKIGIICLDIYGKDSLSAPVIFPNSNNYYYIYNTQIAFNRILLNTDKGFMSVDISDSAYNLAYDLKKVIDNYRFVCKYGNSTQNIDNGDTLILDQEDLKLQFDIINPNGKGSVVYFAQLEKNLPTQLTTNELGLPTLKPDRYYVLAVNATDEIWKSSNKVIILYVKPYWYQTKVMVRLIWLGTFIMLLLLIVIIILVTRRLVLNASEKKSRRMEMELKAIYSQINPHFIFNSLNSALLLISKNRMEDAYTHVSKFSRLLRSYIKSSRNKFITVQSEISNLRNYIELQQVRFKEKFTYEINDNEIAGRSELVIPSLLLQPFVENAIEHGLLNKQGVGHLKIDFSVANNSTLICTIDDDGIGRDESRKISKLNLNKEESYGDLLVKDLVTIFNKYESVHVDIQYEDKMSPLSGTVVTIIIVYLKSKP